MILFLRSINMLQKNQRKHMVITVVMITFFTLLTYPAMVQTSLAHDRISNHTILAHDHLIIHTTASADEGSALCSIADKIPQLTTYPSLSPTQRWSKTPTCPPSSTSWCAWKGITCTSGSVTAIDLSNGFGNLVASNGLGKTALSLLTALTNVASFNMAGNSLTGNIPTSIGTMTSLTYLDLSAQGSNQFYGSIPQQFSTLTNLISLQLFSNKLTKTIPSYIGSALTKLTSLGLYSNSLTGTIPATMSTLTQLLSLRMDTNVLQGTIPAFFGTTLTQMTTLNLGSNYLTGTVPVALSNIGTLTLTLTYTINCLSGTGSPTSQTHCLTPTGQPSSQPSRQPSSQPSRVPTMQPSRQPVNRPTAQPSNQPSMQPSNQPSGCPSIQPSSQPSLQPTRQPSRQPSQQPSRIPTMQPSNQPTVHPSQLVHPSGQPSMQPSGQPSRQPTQQPSLQPSQQPSVQPSAQPTMQPSGQPTHQPSQQPSSQPSSQPSIQPTSRPSGQPCSRPSSKPSCQPSRIPSTRPSVQPTVRPTAGNTVPKVTWIRAVPSQTLVTLRVLVTATSFVPGVLYCVAVKRSSAMLTPLPFSDVSGLKSLATRVTTANSGYSTMYAGASASYAGWGAVPVPGIMKQEQIIVGLNISSLAGLASYTAYCYSEPAVVSPGDTAFMTLAEVVKTRKDFNTSCCLPMSFANAPLPLPSEVYGDSLAAYIASGASPSQYVFSYTLPVPKTLAGNVSVHPVLHPLDAAARQSVRFLTALPATMTFAPTAAVDYTAQGSFYFAPSDASHRFVNGSFSLSLVLSGNAAQYYTPPSPVALRVLARGQPLSAPRLISCRIGSSGGWFDCVFSGPTDMAGRSTAMSSLSWSCSDLLTFSTMQAATTMMPCRWLDAATVRATFLPFNQSVSAVNLGPGDVVTLAAGVILRSQCASSTTVSTSSCGNNIPAITPGVSVTIVAPLDSIAPPVVVLVMPSTIGPCADLRLDLSSSTGAYGRPWQSSFFTVTASAGNGVVISSTQLTAFANILTTNFDTVSGITTAPQNAMTPGYTYQITASLLNFLGQSGVGIGTVLVSTDVYLPNAHIVGPSTRSVVASSATQLYALAALSNCSNAATASVVGSSSLSVYLQWTLLNGTNFVRNDLIQANVDPKKLLLAPHTLQPGSSYLVVLTAQTIRNRDLATLSSINSTTVITVAHGSVVAVIRGGQGTRQVSVDAVLTVDASASYDQDGARAGTLVFQWSCQVLSLARTGTMCPSVFPTIASSAMAKAGVLTLPGNSFSSSGGLFSLDVTVFSHDLQRFDTASISVAVVGVGAPIVTSATKLTRFNVDTVLSLSGALQARTSATLIANWTVYGSAGSIPLTSSARTPFYKTFVTSSGAPAVLFPLSLSPYALAPGLSYTFRLSACPSGACPALTSYVEMTLIANGPPTSGYLTVSPDNGLALQTSFALASVGWTDDPSDYPLMYDFYFQILAQPTDFLGPVVSPYPSMRLSSLRLVATLDSSLPAGQVSASNLVVLSSRAVDIYKAAATAYASVTVVSSSNTFNLTSYINKGLSTALNTGDADLLGRTIALSSSSFSSAINCTAAPPQYCAALNRYACGADPVVSNNHLPNTCGSCLDTYRGVIGASNSPCVYELVYLRPLGAKCSRNSQCLLNLCANGTVTVVSKKAVTVSTAPVSSSGIKSFNPFATDPLGSTAPGSSATTTVNSHTTRIARICQAPMQVCPSHAPENVCSGHGSCTYTDVTSGKVLFTAKDVRDSSNSMSQCTVVNPYCVATCQCSSGYAGRDCSASAAEVSVKQAARQSLCAGLVDLVLLSDPSPHLLDTLAAMLGTVFDAGSGEVTSDDAKIQCAHVLKIIGVLAGRGFLQGSLPSTQALLAQVASDFVAVSGTTGSTTTSTGSPLPVIAVSNASILLSLYAEAAVTGLTTGVSRAMVAGQSPQEVVTANIRAKVSYDQVTAGQDNALSPPSTDAETTYGLPGPKVLVPGGGMAACAGSGGYAKVSIVQFGSNPHGGGQSNEAKSPLLQFSSDAPNTAPSSSSSSSNAGSATGVFYLTQQFPTPQNFSAQQLSQHARLKLVRTFNDDGSPIKLNQANTSLLPVCRIYNSATGTYMPCGPPGHCNISSLSNHNVTFRCAGVQQSLCPGAASAGGRSVRALLEDQFERLHKHALRLRQPKSVRRHLLQVSPSAWPGYEEEEELHTGDFSEEGEEGNEDEKGNDDIFGLGFHRLHEASWSYQRTVLFSTNDSDGDALRDSIGIYHHGRGRRLKGAPKGGKKGGGVKTARKRTAAGGGHDDYLNNTHAIDDGGYPPSDDLFRNTQGLGIEEFATFTDYLGLQIIGVLTKNPFANFNLSKATPALALTFSLMGLMLLGSLIFLRWDKYDRHEEIYLADIKSRLRQRWIYEDLHAGGSGILIETSLSPMERINGVKQPMVFAAASARNYVQRAVNRVLRKPKGQTADVVGDKGGEGDENSSDGGLEMFRVREDGPANNNSLPYHQQQSSGNNFDQPTRLLHLDAVSEGGYTRSLERKNNVVDYIPLPTAATSLPSKNLHMYTYGKSPAEAEAVLKDTLPESMDFSDPLHAAVLVSEFTNQVLPGKDFFKVGTVGDNASLVQTLGLITKNHYMLTMFQEGSMSPTRLMRWLLVCHGCLVGLFFDTLFFSMFFPTDATCPHHETKKQCLATPSQLVVGSTMCAWDPFPNPGTPNCTINHPPSSLIFVLIISLVVLVYVLPVELVNEFLVLGLCAKKPCLEKLRGWCPSSFCCTKQKRVGKGSGPRWQRHCCTSDDWLGRTTIPGVKTRQSAFGIAMQRHVDLREQENIEARLRLRDSSDWAMKNDLESGDSVDQHLLTADMVARDVFGDFSSPREEAQLLLAEVSNFIRTNLVTSDAMQTDDKASRLLATTIAIQERLHIAPDGTPVPLTWRQRLLGYASGRHRLERKLKDARDEVDNILEDMKELPEYTEDARDVTLFKYFVMENVSWLCRASLQNALFNFNGMTPRTIHPFIWAAAWLVAIYGYNGFLFYWILAWGLENGGQTLNQWGAIYGVCLIQDIIACEFVKIFISFNLAIIAARPQLRNIRRIITDASLMLLQHGEKFTSDIRVVQHVSPACRAARKSEISDLPSAAILRQIDDADIQQCRKDRGVTTVGFVGFMLLALPSVLMVFGSIISDQFVGLSLSTLWTFFILANSMLFAISSLWTILVWTILPFLVFCNNAVVNRAKRRADALRKVNRMPDLLRPRGLATSYQPSLLRRMQAEMIYHRDKAFDYLVYAIRVLPGQLVKTALEEQRRVWQQWAILNKYPTVTTKTAAVSKCTFVSSKSHAMVPLPLLIRQMVPHYNDPMGIRRALTKVKQTLKVGNLSTTTTSASPIAPVVSTGGGGGGGGGGVGSQSSDEASDWAFERIDEGLHAWLNQDSQPDYLASPVRSANIPGFGINGGVLMQAERFRAICEITSDPQVAVRRLLLRHITGAVAYDQGKFTSELLVAGVVVSDVWLTFGEALALLQWVWRAFYPAQLRLTEEERREAVERLIAWWMTDAFPPVGSPSHPLPPPSTPKDRRRRRRKPRDVPNPPVFSTPRGTPQRVANTTLGDMSRRIDDRDRYDEKSGDDVVTISPAPYASLLPRDAPDDGFLSPSLLSTPKGQGSTFVGDFFFRSNKNKGSMIPMYSTSLVLDDNDGKGNQVGVTVEELQLEQKPTTKKDLVKLGSVMDSAKSDGERPVEKAGTLAVEDDEESDVGSDTSSQAAAMLLQAQATVSFDRFAQWFLGFARELGHRAGGRHGRRKGGRAVYPDSDDDDPSMNPLTMNTPDRPRYYLSPITLGFEGWSFLGFIGLGHDNPGGGDENNSECGSDNSFDGWSSM